MIRDGGLPTPSIARLASENFASNEHSFSIQKDLELLSGPAACRSPGVSLVIPAYNEEQRLSGSLQKYLRLIQAYTSSYEIIVVADGSDATPEAATAFKGQNVRVIESSSRLGKGGAIMKGVRAAQYETIGLLDADGSISGPDFTRLLERSAQVDCVLASRWLPDSRWEEDPPLSRRVASRSFNILVRSMFGLPFKDTQCGAKFISRRAINCALYGVSTTNFTFDVSLLFHLQKAGVGIEEVPVTWKHDINSKVRLGRTGPLMLATLVGIRIMNTPLARYFPPTLIRRIQEALGVA